MLARILCRAGVRLIPVVVCLLALLPMWPVARNFSTDWYNHLWLIEYAGYHLWLTGTPPVLLNTPQAIGMPILLFYAQKFYTVLGAFSFTLGSALVLRLAAFLLLLLQFYHVQRAVRATGAPACLRRLLPVLVSWQVFQATTLYERGDVTEYFATVFLTICVVNLYVLTTRIAQHSQDPYGFWSTGLYYGLAGVTHPLTAVYGGAYVAVTGLSILVATRSKRVVRFALLNFLAVCVVLAPWMWVMLRYARRVNIANTAANAADLVNLFANSPLSMLFRAFSPASFCAYATKASVHQVSAELNIQLSLPLLALVVVLPFACHAFPLHGSAVLPVSRTMLGTAYGIFWITLLGYCSPACSALFGHAFDALQFAFRLGAYVNLALLLGCLALMGLVDWTQVRSVKLGPLLCRSGAVALVILCGVGWFSKCYFIELSHIYAEGVGGLETLLRQRHFETRTSGYWVPGASNPDDAHLTELPATGYFRSAYDVVTGLRDGRELKRDTRTQVTPFELGTPFGSVLPTEVDLKERTLVMTNVNPFPWNELLLDGRPVPSRELLAIPSFDRFQFPRLVHSRPYALFLEPGRHRLAYRFSPDPPWRWLNAVSWVTLAGWIVAGCVAAGRPGRSWLKSTLTR